MTAEPWFDPSQAYLFGAVGGPLVGLWGAALGIMGGLLVPKGRGKPLVFGLLGLGVVAGVVAGAAGLTALLTGQLYAIWYPFTLCGGLLTALSVPFVFIMRHRYRQVELRKMQADELGV